MRRLVFDAGPLITACKFSAGGRLIIDHILDHCEITIAASVRDEVVLAGIRYPDAQVAQQRIDRGEITVLVPSPDSHFDALIAPYGLGNGERDSILLAWHTHEPDVTLVLDDHLAYLVSDRLGQHKRFLLDVITDLVNAGELDKKLALKMVQAIRTRYPSAFVEHTLILLQR
jgi:hypothetical protein